MDINENILNIVKSISKNDILIKFDFTKIDRIKYKYIVFPKNIKIVRIKKFITDNIIYKRDEAINFFILNHKTNIKELMVINNKLIKYENYKDKNGIITIILDKLSAYGI